MVYSPAVQIVQRQAAEEARRCDSARVEAEHIMIAVCRFADTRRYDDNMLMDILLVKRLFDAGSVQPVYLAEQLLHSLRQDSKSQLCSVKSYSDRYKRVFEEAEFQAQEEGHCTVGIYQLLINLFLLLEEGSPAKELIRTRKGDWTRLLSQLKLSRYIPSWTEYASNGQIGPAPRWKDGDTILCVYKVIKFNDKADSQNPAIVGGMGQVYRVWHQNWNIDLVMKVPNQEMLQKVGRGRFIEEAKEWIRLGLHPNLVTCFYVRCLDESGFPCIFAEYIDGGSLNQWIRSGRLYAGGPDKSLRRILDIAIQFAWGLYCAHGQDLIHQDVKPENVMMTSDGVAKVTDFGGGFTWAYCSPEQANASARWNAGVDKNMLPRMTPGTDTWSWGLSVLAMLAVGPFWWPSTRDSGSIPPPEHTGVEAANHLERYLTSTQGASQDDLRSLAKRFGLVRLLRRCFQQDARPDMKEIAKALKDIYRKVSKGEEYPRQAPKPLVVG